MNSTKIKMPRFDDKVAMGRRIAERRKIVGLTQEEISGKLNMERAAYSMYEIGKSLFPSTELNNLAEILRCSVMYILGSPDRASEETEVLTYWHGLTPEIKPAAKAILKSMSEQARSQSQSQEFTDHSQHASETQRTAVRPIRKMSLYEEGNDPREDDRSTPDKPGQDTENKEIDTLR